MNWKPLTLGGPVDRPVLVLAQPLTSFVKFLFSRGFIFIICGIRGEVMQRRIIVKIRLGRAGVGGGRKGKDPDIVTWCGSDAPLPSPCGPAFHFVVTDGR